MSERWVDRYCRNCGDPFDMPLPDDPRFNETFKRWRPCPNPSPGRPMVDCGVGGHMYDLDAPGVD